MNKCKCGCGQQVSLDKQFIHGHNLRLCGEKTRFKSGQKAWNKGQPSPWTVRTHKGKSKDPKSIAKRTATRLKKNNGVYQLKRGWKHTDETKKKMSDAVKKRDLAGKRNPFYNHTHSPETRAILSAKLSGSNHPQYKGNKGVSPYGPEFTKKLKRMIRDRDNHTCQRCGKGRQKGKRSLDVHHIDHGRKNNDPTNLVTVCNPCNVWLAYYKEHFILPNPPLSS